MDNLQFALFDLLVTTGMDGPPHWFPTLVPTLALWFSHPD